MRARRILTSFCNLPCALPDKPFYLITHRKVSTLAQHSELLEEQHFLQRALVHESARIDETVDANFAAALLAQARSLRAYARRLAIGTGADADADDLLQDTMLRCWTARSSFIPGTSLSAWSRTVMRNGFLSERRRARFEAHLPEDVRDKMLSVSGSQESSVALNDVQWALSELVVEQREAVLLASQGISPEEGALRLSIPIGTFKSRVSRGRLRLRQLTDNRDTPLVPAKAVTRERSAPKLRRSSHHRRDWSGVLIG
jgi:RNA polymerase sigma-70 factor (ECF subfamily)